MENNEENNSSIFHHKEINNKFLSNINKLLDKNFLSNFDSCICALNNNKNKCLINNHKIFIYFTCKYSSTRYINYILKKENKLIKIHNKKLNKIYLNNYALFYIFIFINKCKYEEKIKNLINNQFISIKKFFKFVKILFRSGLLTCDEIINILKFFLIIINDTNKNYKIDLPLNHKINLLSTCIKYTEKLTKLINLINSQKNIINNEEFYNKLYKEIFSKIFDFINNKKNNEYLSIINYFRKEESIFLLLKILNINEKFINKENKKEIESNIIQFLTNNFRKEHLNYFYKIIGKLLIKFNNLKQDKDFSILLKQDFSLLSMINEILIKIIHKENEKYDKEEKSYYCDKGFVFNNKNNTKYGMSIKNVINNFNKKNDNNFCILFTFLMGNINENENNNEKSYIIFSILDTNNKEIFSLYIKKNNLYLRYCTKNLVDFTQIKIKENIKFNNYYSFFMLYNKKEIKISINNNDVLSHKENKLEFPKEFNINIGFFESNINKDFSSFYGIICPIIIFYLKDGKNKKENIFNENKNLLFNLKNNYYVIGEEYSSNDDYNTLLNYYGLFNELENKTNVIEIYNNIKNIILYINPVVLINSFSKKSNKYKDEKIYKDALDSKGKSYQYSYEFNAKPSLEKNFIYSFKDYDITSFFKMNNGMNYLILQIETMYNFILLMKYNDLCDYKYNKEDFELM